MVEHNELPEPWLRAMHQEEPVVVRSALYSLELANEEIDRWCSDLTNEEFNARPLGLDAVSFHLRHIAGSIDRLLTYAEGALLSGDQLNALKSEVTEAPTREEAITQWKSASDSASKRLRSLATHGLDEPRSVGSKRLPTTLGGLIIHIAEHTQRHLGQLVTTAKAVKGGPVAS